MRSTVIWYALGGGAIIAAGVGFAIEQNLDLHVPGIRDPGGEPPAAVVGAPVALAPAPARPSPPASPEATPAVATAPAPEFDIVRVEPTGETVVAGHAAAGARVELRDGERVLASVAADDSGQFVILPEPLAAGPHRLRLAARIGDGEAQLSKLAEIEVAPPTTPSPVATAMPVEAKPRTAAPSAPPAAANGAAPISSAALSPNPPAPSPAATPSPKPSVAVAALSPEMRAKSGVAPTPVATGGSRLVVSSAKATEPGRLEVEGYADPGSRLRLTLNNAYLAEVTAGPDGRWSLTIERGMTAGLYTLEALQIDSAGGARAQASFDYPQNPAPGVTPPTEALNHSPEPASVQATQTDLLQARQSAGTATSMGASPTTPLSSESTERTAAVAASESAAPFKPAAAAAPAPAAISAASAPASAPTLSTPSHAVIAEVRTTTVVRGDNLWDLARRYYGDGLRYADIYSANTAQIRNPNLIYIGQIFVLPQNTPTHR